MNGLSEFQTEVARLFFSLPASEGFLLAGGGALLASGLTNRPTRDLDFFGAPGHVDVSQGRTQLAEASMARGWRVEVVQDSTTFVRLHLTGEDELIVDLAIDAVAARPPVVSIVGPTFDPEELAGRKLAALFDRAEARDFADVYVLAQRFARAVMLERAAEIDLGFSHAVLADMMQMLDRFTDEEIPADAEDISALRAFFHEWSELLRS